MLSVPIFCRFEVGCSQVQNCFKLGKELAPKAHVQVKFCSDQSDPRIIFLSGNRPLACVSSPFLDCLWSNVLFILTIIHLTIACDHFFAILVFWLIYHSKTFKFSLVKNLTVQSFVKTINTIQKTYFTCTHSR